MIVPLRGVREEATTDVRSRDFRTPELRVAVPPSEEHPAHQAVMDLVAEFIRQGARGKVVMTPPLIGRALAKFHLPFPRRQRRRTEPVIVPMMGARFSQLYAAALVGDVVPYCWDVWEPAWELWARRLRPLRPPAVFVTALQSARFLAEALPQSRVMHLSEATQISRHDPGTCLEARKIGILELGRRHADWHRAITGAVRQHSPLPHLYEAVPGRLVFPDGHALRRGLSDTVISVCFPSSLTHPQRSGGVVTMTQRYLESIASGCLVLGHAPSELVDLMGFNPVVEVDWSNPAEQLLDILASPSSWQPLVDRSLNRLREVGDWSVRVRTALEGLQEIGLV
ncbi:hypothetical protein [Streptomyces sp. NPDC046942]|uniref:hypothetical protein n=1 Tax=Streptomyces sp. NPDC046942 TaxID=3155137 RepID=UPI0033D800C1